ncbi:MAG: hypothetical protein WA890_02565, partial [Micromonospora sp.]
IQPWDHPDLVLARAVAAGVIDADEANLIAATRLEHATLAQAAARIGITSSLASSWRLKAERRLLEAIREGSLAFVPLRPRRRRGVATQQRVAATQQRMAAAQQRVGAAGATQQRRAVGSRVGGAAAADVVLAGQQQAFVGKTSDREAAGVGAPGIGARPA